MDILRKDREDVGPTSSFTGGAREDRVTTILGEDTEFNGTLKFSNTLKIEGRFEGEMTSDGQLVVAKTGVVEAEIKVGAAQVEGKITGNIQASDLVDLRSTAEIHGDISASRLKIEDGVIFVGHASVTPGDRRRQQQQQQAQNKADQAKQAQGQQGQPNQGNKDQGKDEEKK